MEGRWQESGERRSHREEVESARGKAGVGRGVSRPLHLHYAHYQ